MHGGRSSTHGAEAAQGSGDAAQPFAHDWNAEGAPARPKTPPQVLDETLRDGLQSTSARDPSIGEKLELLHRMVELGIDSAAIGIPCAHKRQYEDALRLAREIAQQNLPIKACCAARTRKEDIEPIIDISQRAGIPVEVGTFIGSSPIRQYVENWDIDLLERRTAEAVRFAAEGGLSVLYVTEDTTRSAPDVLGRLYRTAIRNGALRICVADTVGYATPFGASRIVRFTRDVIEEMGGGIGIDWHGHRDRGFDLANCFAAWLAGAERCHGTALGVGERSGNAAMELLLINLKLEGWIDRDLTPLSAYVSLASSALGIDIPVQHAVFGANAFRTATGVHASAMVKGLRMADETADALYSSVPASMVGRKHVIEIGPMSGESNVRHYLASRGIPFGHAQVRAILEAAKRARKTLSESEILRLARMPATSSSAPAASGRYTTSTGNVAAASGMYNEPEST